MRQARIQPHGHYAFYPCSDDKDQHAEGVAWHVHCGFHSVPSMRHLHLHVRLRACILMTGHIE